MAGPDLVDRCGACRRHLGAEAVGVLEQLGVLHETTGRRRDRIFGYDAYLQLLRAGQRQQDGDSVILAGIGVDDEGTRGHGKGFQI